MEAVVILRQDLTAKLSNKRGVGYRPCIGTNNAGSVVAELDPCVELCGMLHRRMKGRPFDPQAHKFKRCGYSRSPGPSSVAEPAS